MDQLSIYNEILSLSKTGKIIAFVSGTFNVIHPGHLRLLKFASEICDYLVVAVNGDDAPGVSVPEELRIESLQSISFVHYVVKSTSQISDVILHIKPHYIIKGSEFKDRFNVESEIVTKYGGKLLFTSGEMAFSSMDLLNKEFFQVDYSTIKKPSDYLARHGASLKGLKSHIEKFRGQRVLVIGDLIIDDYITCDPIGMSQEDPTIVVTPIETKTFVGGAGVVAAHAKGLGADVTFCSVAGIDDSLNFAKDFFKTNDIHAEIFEDITRPTTRKQRFRAHGKTLLRVNHLRQHFIDAKLSQNILNFIEKKLPTIDLILFSDFNYGCLPQTLVDTIVEKAKHYDIFLAADSQASSQLSDISRFRGMDLITPTEREARLAVQDTESGIAHLAEILRRKADAKNAFITLGSEGVLISGLRNGVFHTDRLPALNTAAKDPAGAGDSMFTTAALALRAGVNIWESGYLGAIAAACQVSRIGNKPLTAAELIFEIDAI